MDSQFDDLAGLYENMASWPFRQYLEIPTVLDLLGDLDGLRILDFGCGTGMYSRWMKQRGARQVVGYDLSEGMLAYARRRNEREPLGLAFTSELPPDFDGSFDLVLAVYVLPYATSWDELLALCRDMARLLRPDGRLVTLPIHPRFAPEPAYYERYGLRLVSDTPYADGGVVRLDLCRPPYDVHVSAHYWSAATLERALRSAGFTSVQWKMHHVSEDGRREHEPDFWRSYLEQPHAAILDCRRG